MVDKAESSARFAEERCVVYLGISNAALSAASLIPDSPSDAVDVLKACLHLHSCWVNLKLAAL